jgi:biotin operon repressor
MDTTADILISVARASPPAPAAVSMLAPSGLVSTTDLGDLHQPVIVLGGAPCTHWRTAIESRHDLLYVEVPSGSDRTQGGGDVVLPAGHPATVHRRLGHLLELKQRYFGSLPQLSHGRFSWKGIEVALTPVEVALVGILREHQGEVVARSQLADAAGCQEAGSRAIDAHIHRLRQKLSVPGVQISTERQRGFRLVLV